MQEKIDKWKDAMIEAMKTNEKMNKMLIPVALLLCKEDNGELQPVLVPLLLESDIEKDIISKTLKEMCKIKNAVALLIFIEAYMSVLNKDEEYKCKPSEDPNSIEIVNVIFETKVHKEATIYKISGESPNRNLELYNSTGEACRLFSNILYEHSLN